MDRGARQRLLLALAASSAVHLSLLYTVRVAPPAPPAGAPPLQARLQAGPMQPEPALPPIPVRAPSAASRAAASPPLARADADRHASASPARAPDVQPALATPLVQTQAGQMPALEVPLVQDTTWYPARQLDVFPQPVSDPKPAYPEPASAQGVRGEVTLLVLVDETGTVHAVSVVEAQPEGYFEAAAVAAFEKVRFEPARKDGRAVRSRILVKVAFSPEPEDSTQ